MPLSRLVRNSAIPVHGDFLVLVQKHKLLPGYMNVPAYTQPPLARREVTRPTPFFFFSAELPRSQDRESSSRGQLITLDHSGTEPGRLCGMSS